MKARVKDSNQKLVLSIGMIVKNEEKYLEDCLKALSPIREAVSNELIIVDTGSTDRTVEIAEKYADQVLHFEWCDDFSAARNVSLEAASGEWFLYLDGDEILEENCDPIIEFLKMPNNPYGTASLIQRNYVDFEHTDYSDFRMIRLHRNISNIRFHGSIHEYIRPRLIPTKDIPVFAHHDGYVQGVNEKKQKRNQKLLLLEREKNPEDARVLRHLIDTYSLEKISELEERTQVARKLIQIVGKKGSDHTEWLYAYHAMVFAALARKEYASAQQLIQEYFWEKNKGDLAVDMEMRYYQGMIFFDTAEYPAAKEAYLEYQRLYQLYQSGKLNTHDIYSIPVAYATPYYYALTSYAVAKCWQDEKNYPEAKAALARAGELTEKTLDRADASLMTEFLYAYEAEDYSRLVGLLEQASSLRDGKGWKEYAIWFEKRFGLFDEQKKNACLAIAQSNLQNPFVPLCKLRTAQTRKQVQELLEQLLQDADAVKTPLFADMLYQTVFYQFDLQCTLSVLDSRLIEKYWETLAGQRPDWPELLDAYLLEHPLQQSDSPICWFWQTRLMLSLLFNPKLEEKWLDEEHFTNLAERYLHAMSQYVQMLYQPAMLLPENRLALPAEYRFILSWQEADALREQDDAAYLQQLSKMLEDFPLMHRLIELPIAQTRQRLEEQKQQQDEFALLAENVKQQFYWLASNGQIVQARQVLDSYRALCPNDTELSLMESQLGGHSPYTLES